jgi:16S rRNA (guanine966-N2)-methyltransferase
LLRIIAGEYRSRRLATPAGEDVTRPYAQRVKESVFGLLRGWFEGARVLDLFAGVGTMGLEAASRGAAAVTMVERDRRTFQLLEQNIAALGCGDRVRAVCADALGQTALAAAPSPADVVFIDPPYALMEAESSRARVLDLGRRCRAVMAARSFLVLRSPVAPPAVQLAIPGLDGPEVHAYGRDMCVLLYAPAETADP